MTLKVTFLYDEEDRADEEWLSSKLHELGAEDVEIESHERPPENYRDGGPKDLKR